MTIATKFTNWQALPAPRARESCSPNLNVIAGALEQRWPGWVNLGCYAHRPVRGSDTVLSSHSWGAAVDLSWSSIGRELLVEQILPFLVAWSGELGIDAIHDYVGQRIWRTNRTAYTADACTAWWKAQRQDNAGMGRAWATWIHIETCEGSWGDDRPLADRGIK